MYGFSLIGTPAGYDSLHVELNREIDIDSFVDLPNREINIFPNSEIYRFILLIKGNDVYCIFVLYRYALEINNTRQGSFYGSVLTFKNKIANSNYILNGLRDLADIIKENCLDEEGRFFVKVRNITEAKTPDSVKMLDKYCKIISTSTNPQGGFNPRSIFLKTDHNNGDAVKTLNQLKQVVIDGDFRDFQSFFVSDSPEVLEYVHEKGLMNIITIQKLEQWVKENKKNKGKPTKNDDIKSIDSKTKDNDAVKKIEKQNYDAQRIEEKYYSLKYHLKLWLFGVGGFFLGVAFTIILYPLIHSDIKKINPIPKVTKPVHNEIVNDTAGKASKEKDCEWEKESRWRYTKSEAKTIKELIELIMGSCNAENCSNWPKKIEQSLRINNVRDIQNDSILNHGYIIFRLSKKCNLPDEEFELIN